MTSKLSIKLTAIAALTVASSATAATIEWDAGGDGLSTFQEANWVVTDETGSPSLSGLLGMDPPGGFVNPETDVAADMVVGGVGAAGGPAGAGGHVDLGTGLSLTVNDDATFNVRINDGSNNRGIRGVPGGAVETLVVQDNASVRAQFFNDILASLEGAAEVTFGGFGTGTFAGSTTMELAADWTGSVTWLNFADVSGSNLIGKITLGGQPAVEGVNVLVTNDGNRSVLTSLVPEPSSAVVMILGLLGVVARRGH